MLWFLINCLLRASPVQPSWVAAINDRRRICILSFSPLKSLNHILFYCQYTRPHVIYTYSINNRTPQWDLFHLDSRSFKDFFFGLCICVCVCFNSTLGQSNLWQKEDPYLLFRCWMLPRHLKRPFTMMAMRVHSASHSSMLLKRKSRKFRSMSGKMFEFLFLSDKKQWPSSLEEISHWLSWFPSVSFKLCWSQDGNTYMTFVKRRSVNIRVCKVIIVLKKILAIFHWNVSLVTVQVWVRASLHVTLTP